MNSRSLKRIEMNRTWAAFLLIGFVGQGAIASGPQSDLADRSVELRALEVEVEKREQFNISAYQVTTELCYIFEFRKARELPLVTTLASLIEEDAALAAGSFHDRKLRQSLRRWLDLAGDSALSTFRPLAEESTAKRLINHPEYRRAVNECSQRLGFDLSTIFDSELLKHHAANSMGAIGVTTLLGARVLTKAVRLFGTFGPRTRTALKTAGIGIGVVGTTAAVAEVYGWIDHEHRIQAMNENSRNTSVAMGAHNRVPRCSVQFDSELERDLAIFARLTIEGTSEPERAARFDQLRNQNDAIEVMNSNLRRRKLELEESTDPAVVCTVKETNLKIGMILIYFAALEKRK